MFELVTISNGVAVVQHLPSGLVYRFRPIRPGLWCTLTLAQIDAHDPHGPAPDQYAGAALSFAEAAALSACQAATEIPTSTQPLRQPWFLSGPLHNRAWAELAP